MSNMMTEGVDSMVEALMEHASIEATYQRTTNGVTSSVDIDVIPGSSLLRITDTVAERMVHTDRDYFIDPADLGSLYPPQRGDRVLEGGSVIYEVLALPGESVWKHEDQYGRLIMVHTKRIKG